MTDALRFGLVIFAVPKVAMSLGPGTAFPLQLVPVLKSVPEFCQFLLAACPFGTRSDMIATMKKSVKMPLELLG